MAIVTLGQLWIHDADDLASFLRFYTMNWASPRSVPGEVRSYGPGRLRTVTRPGKVRSLQRTLRAVTADELDQLDAWLGADVMLRDHHGRLMFGAYFDLSEVDYKSGSGYDVPLTFHEVTRSVAV